MLRPPVAVVPAVLVVVVFAVRPVTPITTNGADDDASDGRPRPCTPSRFVALFGHVCKLTKTSEGVDFLFLFFVAFDEHKLLCGYECMRSFLLLRSSTFETAPCSFYGT